MTGPRRKTPENARGYRIGYSFSIRRLTKKKHQQHHQSKRRANTDSAAQHPAKPNPNNPALGIYHPHLPAQTICAALSTNAFTIPISCTNPIPRTLVLSAPYRRAPRRRKPRSRISPSSTPISLAGVRDALLRRLHRIDYDAPWRDVVGGGLFFFVWGRVLWSLRRWEALGEFAGR